MSTLTKVFVVLLTVFSIAFTVMTVSITAQTTNWRDLAQKYENHAVVADTHLRNMIAANAAELASARDALSASLTKIKELEEANKKSSDEAAQLKLEQARAAAEKSNAEAMNRGLLAQLQVAEDGRSEYRKQRDDLETRNAEIETRNIDLNDRVNELTAQVTVLLEQRRQFEQQLALLKSENERLATSTQRVSSAMSLESPTGKALPGVSATSPVATRAIRGRLTDVQGDMVTLSVGSADGVQKEMRFVIYRDDQYVGDLMVSLVEPNQCAGRLIRTKGAPNVGDAVVDEIGLLSSRN